MGSAEGYWQSYQPPYPLSNWLNSIAAVLLQGWLRHEITHEEWDAIEEINQKKPLFCVVIVNFTLLFPTWSMRRSICYLCPKQWGKTQLRKKRCSGYKSKQQLMARRQFWRSREWGLPLSMWLYWVPLWPGQVDLFDIIRIRGNVWKNIFWDDNRKNVNIIAQYSYKITFDGLKSH